MKIMSFFVYSCALLFACAPHAVAADGGTNHEATGPASLVPDSLARVEIVYVPTNLLTRARVTPSWLEKNFRYKVVFRELESSEHARDLRRIISKMRVERTSEQPDLRWGLLFYDEKDRRLGDLFLSGDGGIGYLKGQRIKIDPALHEWLVSHISKCFR